METKSTNHKKSQAIKTLEELVLKANIAKYPSFPYHPKPKFTDKTSNGLTKAVIEYLRLNQCQAERINSTGFAKDTRQTSTDVLGRQRTVGGVKWIKSTTTAGTADISAVLRGKAVKIEIKCKSTGDNKQSDAQKEYQRQVETAGGIYLIVRTFEDFYNWFNQTAEEVYNE